MKRDLVNLNLKSSIQPVEKDIELILKKLFIENKPLSDELKKLLIINTKDCLDGTNASKYKILIDNMKLKDLREKMTEAAQNLEFEKAAVMRERIKALESVSEKQKITLSTSDTNQIAISFKMRTFSA